MKALPVIGFTEEEVQVSNTQSFTILKSFYIVSTLESLMSAFLTFLQ